MRNSLNFISINFTIMKTTINKILWMVMFGAALLFSTLEVQAQRTSSSRSGGARTSESNSRGSSGNSRSSSETRTSNRSRTTNESAVRSGRATTTTTRTSAATLETRGQVQTGTNNENLKADRVSPSENYRKLPARGASVSKHKAVKKAQFIKHHNDDFYYKHGVFYRHANDHYIVSRPPIGIRVATIPTPRVVWMHDVRYYYYYGVFYTMTPTNEYEVVLPPVGAIVESIPEGYEKLEIDGNTYYIVDGVQYKAVVYNGEIWYEVLKILD